MIWTKIVILGLLLTPVVVAYARPSVVRGEVSVKCRIGEDEWKEYRTTQRKLVRNGVFDFSTEEGTHVISSLCHVEVNLYD